MAITERTLKKWRKEALKDLEFATLGDRLSWGQPIIEEVLGRILRLTQELLDQHLLRKR